MNKLELLTKLEIAHEEFLDLIEDLDETELTAPGVCEEWSCKDIMSHLSHWEAELIRLLWQAKQGMKPGTAHFTAKGKLDEVNQIWANEARTRPLSRVIEDFHAVRAQTILRVEEFSELELTNPTQYPWLDGNPLCNWIENDSFGHESDHATDLQNYRKLIGK